MKSTLAKSLVEHIITDNQSLKTQVVHLKRDLKKIQDKMIEALENLSSTYSSKLKNCQKILLFDTPYQCLAAFVEEMAKIATFSIQTAKENQQLLSKNRKIQYRINSIEQELIQRKKHQQQTINGLNEQIQAKKAQLRQLQEDYQDVLKAKKVAQKQLGDTKQHMKILRLKLYEQQRQKLTEIIVANKKQMIDFRRSMEMEAYKLELQYKKNMQEKDTQIRTLTQNIEELINNNLTHTSDLTVLQKIVQPMRNTTMLKNEVATLKKEIGDMKQQIRDKYGMILGLEGKVADMEMIKQNLKSHNERLQIQKSLLTKQLNETNQQLKKERSDRQALDLYYSQKWHAQFSKVKANLQDKFTKKHKQLEKQFEKKRKQVEAEILGYVERIRVMKIQVTDVKRKNEQLTKINDKLKTEIDGLKNKNSQVLMTIREADAFHTQELRSITHKLGSKICHLQSQNRNLSTKNRSLQFQFNTVKADKQLLIKSYLRQKLQQNQQLNSQHRKEIEKLKKQHKKQIQQLQRAYGNMNEVIKEIRLEEQKNYELKEKQLALTNLEKIKQVQTQCQTKIKRFSDKLSQSQTRYQKLRKTKEQQLQELHGKLSQSQDLLHQRQKQLISRDVQLQEYKKMRQTYMGEVARLNSLLNEQVFLNNSMKLQLETTVKKVVEKQKIIQELQSKKHIFKTQLQEFQKLHLKQLSELMQTHKKLNSVNRKKIKQLQTLFQNRPIKQQHLQKIKSLEKKNSQLRTQIHLKQAENAILNQVKDYYQQKAFYGTVAGTNVKIQIGQNATKQQLLSTCTFLKTANSFLRPTTNQGGFSIVKKYRSRKNKLITSSYNKFDTFQEQEKVGKQESNDINRMKRYLLKQHNRGNGAASFEFKKTQELKAHGRTKSCLG